jgi:hypothetical protein
VLKQLVGLYDFVSFVYGNYYYFGSHSCTDSSSPIYIVSTIMLIIGYIGILVPIVLFIYIARLYPEYVFPPPRERVQNNQLPVSQQRLDTLPTIQYTDGLFSESDSNCSICLVPYEVDISVRTLPCCHHYHQQCIDQWLLKRDSCPLCARTLDEATKYNEQTKIKSNNN